MDINANSKNEVGHQDSYIWKPTRKTERKSRTNITVHFISEHSNGGLLIWASVQYQLIALTDMLCLLLQLNLRHCDC